MHIILQSLTAHANLLLLALMLAVMALALALLPAYLWQRPGRQRYTVADGPLSMADMRRLRRIPLVSGGSARLSERYKVVFVKKPADHGGAVMTGESINMGKLKRVLFIIQMGAITGNAALTLKSGATDGVQTTAETFRYRLADADQASADADTYGDWATSSSLTMTGTTYDNRTLLVEIDSDELTDGQPWLTLEASSITALNCAVVAIGEPAYEAHDVPTVI